jgi:hypothetical protein
MAITPMATTLIAAITTTNNPAALADRMTAPERSGAVFAWNV